MDWPLFAASGWIWAKEKKPDDGTPHIWHFRKAISIDKVPSTAVVRLSADSRYRFFVNGVSVSFGPCKGDGQVWHYEEIDIAPYLVEGTNVIAAVVLRYSLIEKGNNSIWRTATPGLYMEGEMEYDDLIVHLKTDSTWLCRCAEEIAIVAEDPRMNYLHHLERAQGNIDTHNWMSAEYDDVGWHETREYNNIQLHKGISPAALLPRPIPPMLETPRLFSGVFQVLKTTIPVENWNDLLHDINGVEIPANSEHIIEINAGAYATGFIRLSLYGGKDSEIQILTSEGYAYPQTESINEPQKMVLKGDRTDSIRGQLVGFTDIYRVAGCGTKVSHEVYEPFWFRAFRFIKLHIKTLSESLVITSFNYRETRYPLEVKTTVESSWSELQPIWDISLRTLKFCMHETYEDCPFYEQLQYIMDARSQILYTYAISADDRMARRTMEDIHRSLRADGLTNCCWPTVAANIIPGFSLYYIMMINDHMMYFGDRELVQKFLPTVDAILNFFDRNRDERGLVDKIGGLLGEKYWSFIDWTPEWRETSGVPDAILEGPITMESLLYAYALDRAAELAVFVNKPEQAADYLKRAYSMKSAVNARCLGENGLYCDGPGVEKYSQHTQVWAVLSETAREDSWSHLMRRALDDAHLAKCSVAMAFYLFRALEKSGLYDETLELWNPWRQMIADNLTTCVEDSVNARSDCHAWGALMLYEAPSALLGIKPTQPGYMAAEIRPQCFFEVDRVSGSAITPHGSIQISWEKTPDGIKLDVKAPDTFRAEEIQGGVYLTVKQISEEIKDA